MKISELVKLTGLSKDTIRFYEKERLISAPKRDANGYRNYEQSTVQQLQLIGVAKNLGFTLSEIRDLAELLNQEALSERVMAEQLKQKSKEIEQKIQSLVSIKEKINEALDGLCEQKDVLTK